MTIYLEFAECPLGHPTPIRPAMLFQQGEDQKWTAGDVPFVVVACNECKRVYSFETEKLRERGTLYGLSPYNPYAPMHVFRVTIRCDQKGCDTPLSVIAVRKRDTTAEELQKEIGDWTWENLKCRGEHQIPDRKKAER